MRNTSIAQFVLKGELEITARRSVSGCVAIHIHDAADEGSKLNDVTLLLPEAHAQRVEMAIKCFTAAMRGELIEEASC